jgi:hypothetical protein
MKRTDLKKTHTSKKAFRGKLLRSFKRALRIGAEPRSTSNLQIFRKELPDTFLTNDEKKINVQLLKMEMQKAQAIQLIREKTCCV